jgi:hypothetical protein
MSSEDELRALIEDRARCIERKDAEAALAFYADDVVNFDLARPLAYRGHEAKDPAELQEWFDHLGRPDRHSFRSARDPRVGRPRARLRFSAYGRNAVRWIPDRYLGKNDDRVRTAVGCLDDRSRTSILSHAHGRQRKIGKRLAQSVLQISWEVMDDAARDVFLISHAAFLSHFYRAARKYSSRLSSDDLRPFACSFGSIPSGTSRASTLTSVPPAPAGCSIHRMVIVPS